jgi:1-phosphofructokinase/tagatose 6-phosphate kinase
MSGAETEPDRRRLLFVVGHPSIDRLHEVDRLTVGAIHRPTSVVVVPGGKGFNAARAAATLGGSVTAVAVLAGRAGDWILERLAGLGIDTRAVRSSGETRTCLSVLDRTSGELTEFYEGSTDFDPGAWDAVEAIVRSELQRGDIAALALSGNLPPGAPPDGYRRIARIAADATHPVPVLADTYGQTLGSVLGARPAIVKVNAEEARDASSVAVSDPRSAAMAADVIRDAGATSVVVTLGPAGAVLVTADDRIRLVPPDMRGAYPVGSGDAFLGGMAVAFARGEPIVEGARLGVAAGIANAQIPGAGSLDPGRIEEILAGVTLQPI